MNYVTKSDLTKTKTDLKSDLNKVKTDLTRAMEKQSERIFAHLDARFEKFEKNIIYYIDNRIDKIGEYLAKHFYTKDELDRKFNKIDATDVFF